MSSRFTFLLLLALLLGTWYFGCQHESQNAATLRRPNDPWVFRSVLDKQPRMITFALSDNVWAAYSTDSCSLYKIWSGSVDFSGAVYNMRHGPQPMTIGNAWFENKHRQPWQVSLNGKTETPATDYKGHRYVKGGHAEIMFDLVLSDGQRIRINERPEVTERDRQLGFERKFTVENAPAGAVISLRTNASSLAENAMPVSNGEWKTTEIKLDKSDPNLSAMHLDGILTLDKGTTTFTQYFVNKPLVANPFDVERLAAARGESGEAKPISAGEKIMAQSDCRTCHNPQAQTVGPSYVQIAERYKNLPENVEKLSKKVMLGGSGVWGIAAMSAHPDLQPADAAAMVSYILSFDEDEDDGEGGEAAKDLKDIPENQWLRPDVSASDKDMAQGLVAKVWQLNTTPKTLSDVAFTGSPTVEATIGRLDASGNDFGPFKDNFAIEATGYLFMDKDDNVLFQLSSDDGSKLWIDNKLIVDNDGQHGMAPKESEVALRSGFHTVRFLYFQGGGGRGVQLKWARFGDPGMKIVGETAFFHKKSATPSNGASIGGGNQALPGDLAPLFDVHPSYDLSQARPDEFLPKVAGMDFLPDGRLVVSTWDAAGAVYVLDNVKSGDPKKIKARRIAQGLAEPLGLKVVDGEIYVLQKQELTKLVDRDKDGVIDDYICFAKGWRASANFHEFAFGLAYKDDYFYATLAIAINPGGASTRPQVVDRGKVIRISRKDGSLEFIARGLRTPNGIGEGPDGQLFVADNQGDWLPSSKILHVKPGAFYNSYAVDSAAVAQLPVQQPVAWLPQDEIGNSPTQPALLKDGPYAGQLAFGDVCYGGLQRLFMEKVNGEYQGCVFRFTQGLEGGTNRLVYGPDGGLYVGMIGNPGNWGQTGKFWYGLQRMKYNDQSTFEMLAVRAKSNGMEVEFTEPLRKGDGWDPAQFEVKQWRYQPTVAYGGPKLDEQAMTVQSASVSSDRKKVFLEIPGLKAGHVVWIHLRNLTVSEMRHGLWSSEAWYTLNAIPSEPGVATARPGFLPQEDNTLTEEEKAAGWNLLFDGKSIAPHWHNYGKTTIGASWIVNDNSIHLDAKPNPEGHWQAKDGGDLLSAEEYGDFELELDWKIGPCGNSGIFYLVQEKPEKYQYGWNTGPEMQVLDNACHPDSKFPKHRAGDLYDLIEAKYVTVKPAGQWNHVRLVFHKGKVEHWLNYHKLVELQMFENGKPTKKWLDLIAGSKFPKIPAPDFGLATRGHISLQDHGDPIWYKNIKIRKL